MGNEVFVVARAVVGNDIRREIQRHVQNVYEEYRGGRLEEHEWQALAVWLARIDYEVVQGPRQTMSLMGEEA